MDYRTFIKRKIDEDSGKIAAMSDRIWEIAEIRYQEERSSQVQISALLDEGFTVERNVAGMPTAFIASYGTGAPVIGILGEFDALENLSQKANEFSPKRRENNGNGHGCGHNALGTAALYGAVAVKKYLEQCGKTGTVKYYGCPAEEGGSGKTFMVRAGCFHGLNAALTWHPNYYTSTIKTGSLANVRCVFTFYGVSSHAAAAPHLGRNALSAVELMNIGVNYLREHLLPGTRVHYAVTNAGGDAANIIQEEAEVVYAVRAPEVAQLEEMTERIQKIARGAALMTETTVKSRTVSGYSDYISNAVVERIVRNALEDTHVQEYTQEELDYAAKYTQTMETCDSWMLKEDCKLCDYVLDPMPMLGSTDVGDVSWNVPTAQFYMTCYAKGTCLHSWQATAQGKSSIMHKAAVAAAKVIAMAAAEFYENPQLAAQAMKEFERTLAGKTYRCPVPKDTTPGIKR